ncbi:MAG: hypothetical protein PHC75_09635 [Burkholderiales bacterium]|nr:hypothetical protein [Burkholderiales bacterium]
MNQKVIFLLAVLCIVVFTFHITREDKLHDKPQLKIDISWTKKRPQFTNNVGFARLAESSTTYQNKTITQQELIGTVTNQFGIRDEVLELILTSIPESDVRSTIAAIKMVQYDQMEVGITDDMAINKFANKAAAASSCINIPMMDRYNFGQAYDKIIRDNSARKAEWDRIEHLLNGHVISNDYGIQSYDIKEQCDHFLGESR